MTRYFVPKNTDGLTSGLWTILYKGPAIALARYPTIDPVWFRQDNFDSLLRNGHVLDEPFNPVGLMVKVNNNGWFLSTHPDFPECTGEGRTYDESVLDLREKGMRRKYDK